MIGPQELSEIPCFCRTVAVLEPETASAAKRPTLLLELNDGAHSGVSDLSMGVSAHAGYPEVLRGFPQSLKLTTTAPSSIISKFTYIIIVSFSSAVHNI
jgi:hypothetical protein